MEAAKSNEPSEPVGKVRNDAERTTEQASVASEGDTGRIQELEKEVMDLKITNRAKDYFVEQLQKERESFTKERTDYVEKLIASNRKVGELETRLLQLEGPK